jgi:murein DD-endopeptidase MepM/ murein hydrolase activator NlpD
MPSPQKAGRRYNGPVWFADQGRGRRHRGLCWVVLRLRPDRRHPAADGVVTRYAYMEDFAPGIAPGTPVSVGQTIGRIGSTGRAHRAHVHFEVRLNGRAVDPKPYLGLIGCTGVPTNDPPEIAAVPVSDRRGR